MSKHVIFVIHGMGESDATWADDGIAELKTAWSQYDALQAQEFDSLFEIVPIVYDNVFETWRQRMKSDWDSFRSALFGLGENEGGGLADSDQGKTHHLNGKLDQIERWIGAGDPEFIWTHAMDVVLYRFFTTIRMAVDVKVIEQITARLNQGNFSNWSVIGYSLGTSVAHNALNTLYTASVGGEGPLSLEETRPVTVAMVANVSRVLERPGARVKSSLVAPGPLELGRLCSYYLNVRHTMDPFTLPQPFDFSPWPDAEVFNTPAYQHIRPSHVTFSKDELMDVHNFDHYLPNPRVHVPLFRSVLVHEVISDDEYLAAKRAFDLEQDLANLEIVRNALAPKLPRPNATWTAIIDLFKELS